jgi:hypothetical protein
MNEKQVARIEVNTGTNPLRQLLGRLGQPTEVGPFGLQSELMKVLSQ